MKTKLMLLVVVLMCGVIGKCVILYNAVPLVAPDSSVFLSQSAAPVFSHETWAAMRPPTVPLLYKLLGANIAAICLFQVLFSAVCWSTLAVAVAYNIKHRWLSIAGAAVVVCFGLSSAVTMWDYAVLSESISLSLTALLLAALLWALQTHSRAALVAVGTVAALWTFSRDTNAYALLMAVPVLLCAVAFRCAPRRYAMLAGVLLLFSVGSMKSSDSGQRWLFPMWNNVGMRILVNKPMRDWFVAQGMPFNNAMLLRRHTWASTDDYYFYRAPEFAGMRSWMLRDGKRTYTRWMAAHPSEVAAQTLGSLNDMAYKAPPAMHVKGYADVTRWLRTPYRFSMLTLFYAAALCLIPALWYRQTRIVVALLVALSTAPLFALCYWADAMEIIRHSVGTALQFKVAAWLALLFGADVLIPAVRPLAQRARQMLRHFAPAPARFPAPAPVAESAPVLLPE